MLCSLGGGPDDAKEIMTQDFFKSIEWDKLYRKEITPPFRPMLTSDTDTSYFDQVSAVNILIHVRVFVSID